MSTIVIGIDEINSLEEIEKFFTLLCEAGVSYHPERSFHGNIELDENRNIIGPAFSEEESERLDQLTKK